MVRTIVILLLLLSNSVYAQELIDKSRIEILNQKHYEVEYNKEGAIDRESGFLRKNSSEYFVSEHQEAREIAMDYLQKKGQLYGLTDLTEFRLRKVAESLTGEFIYFDQYINGVPVHETNFTIFIDKEKNVRFVSNEFRIVSEERKNDLAMASIKRMEENEAINIAKTYLNISETSNMIGEPSVWFTYFETQDKGLILTCVVNIACLKPAGNWRIFIDNNDMRIIHCADKTDYYTANEDVPALLYNPNPLVTKRANYGEGSPFNASYIGCFWDNPTLNAARDTVILRGVPHTVNLYPNGTGWNYYYIGSSTYCKFEERVPPTTSNTVTIDGFNFSGVIDYKGHQSEFATLMCYYHINESAYRIKDLGFNIDNTGLKGLVVDPHGDDTYFRDSVQTVPGVPINKFSYISFQDLHYGVSSWEDADAIWHEYGHAIQYHFGKGLKTGQDPVEHGSVKEGCSDYWVASNKRPISDYKWQIFGLWFGENRGAVRLSINYSLIYPEDFNNNGSIFVKITVKDL